MNGRTTQVIVVLLIASLRAGFAQPANDEIPHTRSVELERFLDERFPALMRQHNVPGGVIAVVEGNDVLVCRGYGSADLEAGKAVDAEMTLFRVGSLSKLVTATAVMKLTEDSRLDLSRDVRAYGSNLNIEFSYPEPVTLHHLLTHTSGFAVSDIGDAARSESELLSVSESVRRRMTPQTAPPGRWFMYTNQGFTLIGGVIESVMDTDFARATEELVFEPAGIHRSSFEQPFHPASGESLAVGYDFDDSGYPPLPVDFSHVAPADALVTTGADMARFMLLHLNAGTVDDARVLEAATVETMHRRQFGYHTAQPGHAYGFREEFFSTDRETAGRRRAISHTGGQLGFTSEVFLLPEARLGIFICLNRRVSAMRREVVDEILHTFYPDGGNEPEPAKYPVENATRLAGNYVRVDLPRHSVESLSVLLSPPSSPPLAPQENGSIRLGSSPDLWQVGPKLFRSEDGRLTLSVAEREDDTIDYVATGLIAYERVGWYERPGLHRTLLLAISLVFLSSLLVWPFKRWREPETSTVIPGMRQLKGLVLAVSALGLLFVVGVFLEVVRATGSGWDYGLLASMTVLLYIPYGVLAGALALVGVGLSGVATRLGFVWRIHYVTICAATIAFIVLLQQWNLVGV